VTFLYGKEDVSTMHVYYCIFMCMYISIPNVSSFTMYMYQCFVYVRLVAVFGWYKSRMDDSMGLGFLA
jgi:hypothetical protein